MRMPSRQHQVMTQWTKKSEELQALYLYPYDAIEML